MKKSFQEKQNEITIVSRETKPRKPLYFFTRAKQDKQIPPHKHATTPNARLNHCMFQLSEHRPREVDSILSSSCLNRKDCAGVASFPG